MKWALLLLVALLGLPAAAAPAARKRLPNGLQLIVSPNPATEVVAAELMLPIAAADEPPEQAGIRYLTHQLLLRGGEAASGDAMGEQLAAVGGSIGVSVGFDYVEIHVLAPAEGFAPALGILAQAVRTPAFLPEEIERSKQALFISVQQDNEDPFQAAYLAFRQALYGNAPYGRRTQGEPRAVAALDRDDLVRFHHRYYVPSNAILSIAGGVTEDEAVGAAQRAFGTWPRRRVLCAQPPGPARLTVSDAVVRELPVQHAYVMLGVPAPAAGRKPSYYAMQLVDSLLTGGSTARLPRALRQELGLAYQVSSFCPTLRGGSHLGVYVVTEPDRLTAVKDAVVHEFQRLRDEPVPAEELARAKRLLLGAQAMNRQQALSQAYWEAWCTVLGLGPDPDEEYRKALEAVTPAQVQAAARDLMGHFVFAVALPRS